MNHIFRPRHEPSRTLYDAFQAEGAKRKGRPVAEWMDAECLAVWQAAHDYASQHGLRIPTMGDVKKAELSASGHVDYGAKWAYRVAEKMIPQ